MARNLRGMKTVQPHLEPGYCLRAAKMLRDCSGSILIGTGFPVVKTFETDGPVGAIAMYDATLSRNWRNSDHLSAASQFHRRWQNVSASTKSGLAITIAARTRSAAKHWTAFQPDAIISIERPGQAADGGYYNMRGESISEYTACFDNFMNLSDCPTIAIGDGGNEIGMGKVDGGA